MGFLTWLGQVFGIHRGTNVVAETIEVFRPNAENEAQRSADVRGDAMRQFSSEFNRYERGWFNSLINGLNRLPRPIITYTVFGLFAMVFFDPLGFAAMMEALTLVPEQLWELMSIIIMFFFGARELSHFRASSVAKEATRITTAAPQVVARMQRILDHKTPLVASTGDDTDLTQNTLVSDTNEAVREFNARSN